MTWFKVDDSFHSHPKALATDPAALGLWVVAGSWCGANLTNGFVPDHVLPRLAPGSAKLASKLVAAGLWERNGAGYLFHDWADFNPTADKVLAERAAAAERQRRSREKVRHGVTDGVMNTVTDGVTSPAPTRPDPTRRGGSSEGVPHQAYPQPPPPPVDNHAREPPRHCPAHSGGTDQPCGTCRDARLAAERWDRDQATGRAQRDRDGPRCRTHRGQPADHCGLCRADQLAERTP